jgi:hypothetical protein
VQSPQQEGQIADRLEAQISNLNRILGDNVKLEESVKRVQNVNTQLLEMQRELDKRLEELLTEGFAQSAQVELTLARR